MLIGVALWIGRGLTETAEFEQVTKREGREKAPVVEALRRPRNVIAIFLMRVGQNATFNIVSVFVLTYATTTLGMSRSSVLAATVVGAAVACVLAPLYGHLGDRFGFRRVMITALIVQAVFAFPFFLLVNSRSMTLVVIAVTVGIAGGSAASDAIQPACFTAMFGTKSRMSAVWIGREGGTAIGGGLAPLIAAALLGWAGGAPWGIAGWMVFTSLVGPRRRRPGPAARRRVGRGGPGAPGRLGRVPMSDALVPAAALVRASAGSSVVDLVDAQARMHPDRVALRCGDVRVSYRDLGERTRRLATVLARNGVGHSDRVGLVSENRPEYLETILAAARVGAVVATVSTRATAAEIDACLDLVAPSLTLCSPRHTLDGRPEPVLVVGPEFEADVAAAPERSEPSAAGAEDLAVILYTSGTTGTPKGACISHRAEIARSMATRAELGLGGDDAFVAWSPLHHMGALDNSLSTLMSGGTVVVVDGFDVAALLDALACERIGWLLVMPGTVARLVEALRDSGIRPAGVRLCGVMPDLVRPAEIAELTTLLDAPYANTFGSTETGCPPCSAGVIPVGVEPTGFAKEQSAYCEVRLVDPEGRDVADGVPGEVAMRGPTLFSGYWDNEETNRADFRDGWFHMGDVLVRHPDGTFSFVDRVKYMIKSGGENVYPAEIERVLLQTPGVLEAGVVRRADDRWGKVPVAFVVHADGSVPQAELIDACRASLPGFKTPKEIHFVSSDAMPRNASGKLLRHELEKLLTHEKDDTDD
ncbi:MFS transporter [Pseudonocardia sp. N23]|uniref:MFS transporter n=1 Tax=Pseudonocardia sp. N23 TaxID=1987376 RepID=UPI000BFD0152|nr:MFS transporter [Pseudonocardia sp. N23]GAY08117.1 long-chain-fatty-acid--CoA ligase [Pseudonocardia sp. N23]